MGPRDPSLSFPFFSLFFSMPLLSFSWIQMEMAVHGNNAMPPSTHWGIRSRGSRNGKTQAGEGPSAAVGRQGRVLGHDLLWLLSLIWLVFSLLSALEMHNGIPQAVGNPIYPFVTTGLLEFDWSKKRLGVRSCDWQFLIRRTSSGPKNGTKWLISSQVSRWYIFV